MNANVHTLEVSDKGQRPVRFTYPFNYLPHPWAEAAAEEVMRDVRAYQLANPQSELFRQGKMFGVLVVETPDGSIGYLRAFSAMLDGSYHHDGFVPPVVDISHPDGYFKQEEARISAINKRLQEAEGSQVEGLKNERKQRSQALQRWMFSQYKMRNAQGQTRDLLDIFKNEKPILSEEDYYGRAVIQTADYQPIPPSGSGECCAPKLLQFAFEHHLQPLCMAEFWMGASPQSELRKEGQFYPACQSKCKPILRYMLAGIPMDDDPVRKSNEALATQTQILYEDAFMMAVNKPAELLTVPGTSGDYSLLDWLHMPDYLPVHRLDMDTSGIVLIAKNQDAYIRLQQLFLRRDITKRYEAVLEQNTYCARPFVYDERTMNVQSTVKERLPMSGQIALPLSRDPFDRPRQRVDFQHGKTAITDYRIREIRADGTIFVDFFPRTGRTHQLRVHAAHPSGLDSPILGDRLYGDCRKAPRLMLHAAELQFVHPFTNQPITIHCPSNF